MLTPDFNSTVMRSSQVVICLIQRRTSDSSNSVSLIVAFVAEHLIYGFDNSILKNQLIDGSSVAFKTGGFQPADTAPDDGLDASVVPMSSAEYFAVFSADDNLRKAVFMLCCFSVTYIFLWIDCKFQIDYIENINHLFYTIV